jgi:putative hydrolase of the HAD superfamily
VLPIRAVLFDADGVLQRGNGGDLSPRLERALGFLPEPLEPFISDVLDAERPALAGQAELLDLLEPVLRSWGAPGKARALAELWWHCIEPDAAVFSVIAQLRRQGLCCVLATNQQRFRADYMRRTLGYEARFDRSFYSYELGCVKPEPRYFEAIVQSLALPAEQLLFIDDLEPNVLAARGVGLQAAQFVNTQTPEAAHQLRALLASLSVFVVEADAPTRAP